MDPLEKAQRLVEFISELTKGNLVRKKVPVKNKKTGKTYYAYRHVKEEDKNSFEVEIEGDVFKTSFDGYERTFKIISHWDGKEVRIPAGSVNIEKYSPSDLDLHSQAFVEYLKEEYSSVYIQGVRDINGDYYAITFK